MGYEEDIYKRAGFDLDTDRDEMEAFITQQYQSVLTSGKSGLVDMWFEPNEFKGQIDEADTLSALPSSEDISRIEFSKHNQTLKESLDNKEKEIFKELESSVRRPETEAELKEAIKELKQTPKGRSTLGRAKGTATTQARAAFRAIFEEI